MTIPFPALCPRSRKFQPGNYATKRFNTISGTSQTRLYGSKSFDATLDLEFMTDDDGAAALMACYDAARGAAAVLDLPARVFEGMGPTLIGQMPAHLNWRWADRPQINSEFPGQSTVSIQLIATLDA